MGKKKRGSRRNLGFAKQTTEKDGGCLLSGKIVGDTHGKDGDASTSFVAASISGSPVCGDLAVQQPPKSPSLSRTLGECDKATTGLDKTEESGTKVSLLADNRKQDESLILQVFDNLPEPGWGYCLMGYFAGRFPGKKELLPLCDSWKVKYQYFAHSSGWLIFKFEDSSSRDYVLNGGPYFVFGRPLLLKIMPECFEFGNEEISSVPVWVRLPGLPLECWNIRALSKIASKIGRPISMDNITSSRAKISYARVLVEVDASVDLVRYVHICFPTGKQSVQEVIFEHEPMFCSNCNIFGHSSKGCVTYTPPLDSNVNSNEKPSGDNSLGVPSPELSLQCNTADVPSSNVVCPPVPVHSCSGLNALGGSVPDQRILDSGGSQHLHQEDMSEEPLKMGNRKKNNLKSQDVVPVPSSSKVVDKGTSFSIQEAVKSPSMHESILVRPPKTNKRDKSRGKAPLILS